MQKQQQEEKKEEKEGNWKAFCVICKRNCYWK